jgi:putative ABC transport system substrate-binding protein
MGAEMHGKCVELFREILPSLRRVGVLLNVDDPFSKNILDQIVLASRTTSFEITSPQKIRGADEIDAAFAAMKNEGAGAAVIQGSLTTKSVADLALKHGLPTATQTRSFAEVGGLISYGADGPQVFRQSARFVSKIFQGSNPADMPIEQPTKFELVVNLRTAKALGITIPESFLLRADEVIE